MADTEIQLFVDNRSQGLCRGCKATIDWYQTPRGKAMPMNAGAKPQRLEPRVLGARQLGVFSSADSHWSTCPNRAQFAKPAPSPHRAFFGADYDPATSRWHWTIRVHTNNHAKEVARSTITYPTEHDANVGAKDLQQQLRNAAAQLAGK